MANLIETLGTPLLLFVSTFGIVFGLGLQQLNVSGGHRIAAALTSFMIGALNLVLFKLIPQPTSGLELVGYLVGGPVGIVAAMVVHPMLEARLKRQGSGPSPASASAGRRRIAPGE